MKQLLLSVAAVIAGAFVLQAADKDIPAYQDKSLPVNFLSRSMHRMHNCLIMRIMICQAILTGS